MMSSPSSEEVNAQRSDFGLRLSNSMAKYGPLCVGIDPHRQLLTDWGYNVDALGAELYSMRMLQAANGRAAAVKFQSSMFERYGSKGIAALERVLYAARQMGVITIVDCLHGGLPTTISAFADAYFKPGAPLLADAITLLPYYGARSLGGVINDALNNGRGVFIASLTSNQEGASCRRRFVRQANTRAKQWRTASPALLRNSIRAMMEWVPSALSSAPPSGSGSTIRASTRPSSPDRFFPQATDGRERRHAI